MGYRTRNKFDKCDLLNANCRRKEHVDSMRTKLTNYDEDNDRKTRRSNQLCRYCYYVNRERIGGSAITVTNCRNCDKEISFANTCTDEFCPECATYLKQCKHCGGRMD
jgi:hypothetical protein